MGRLHVLFAAAMAVAVGCGQDEITLPDAGGGTTGACGSWYPGGDAGVDGGVGPYEVAEGAIFPCLVWESARKDGENTYINVGEMYLAAKHGISDDASLVVVVGARNCTACKDLITALGGLAGEFDAAGAAMIGVCRTELAAPDVHLSLDEAEEVLVDDGWPAAWPLTNDAERHLPPEVDELLPWIIVIRLSDMRIVVMSWSRFTPDESGAEDLLDFVSAM